MLICNEFDNFNGINIKTNKKIKLNFKKKASATQFAASLPLPGEINDGEKDIGETPINILLLRYLDPISTEDTVRNNNNNNNRLLYYIISIIIVFS